MKPILVGLLLTIVIMVDSCTPQQAPGSKSNVYKKDSVLIFSPSMNAVYFFPFKDEKGRYGLKDFIKHEYDSGFVVSWRPEWKDDIQSNYSMEIQGDNTFTEVAYATVEYAPQKPILKDSVYAFVF